jgi:hypothetical protein
MFLRRPSTERRERLFVARDVASGSDGVTGSIEWA